MLCLTTIFVQRLVNANVQQFPGLRIKLALAVENDNYRHGAPNNECAREFGIDSGAFCHCCEPETPKAFASRRLALRPFCLPRRASCVQWVEALLIEGFA